VTSPSHGTPTLTANAQAVRLELPPRHELLPLAEDVLRRLAAHSQLGAALTDMLTGAVLEVCEELLRAGQAAGVQRPFELILRFDDQAADVAIAYDGRIPLNPHLTEPYEVPAADAGLDGVNMDTLWLHLIKHRMDRVFFEVNGPESRLRMIKYRRGQGEETRLWFLGMTPAPRQGLHVQFSGPERAPTAVLLHDADSGKVFRFEGVEAKAISLMNGQRSMYDIYMRCVEEAGPVSPHRLGALYEALEAAGMLAAADERGKPTTARHWLWRLANPMFSIPHADAVAERAHAWLRPLISPLGALMLLTVGLSGTIPLWRILNHLGQSGLPDLERLIVLHPSSLLTAYALQMVMVACHELAHAVVCKHFGGRVPRMGMMLYLAMFIFYCDTTSSWGFPHRWQRIMVSLAGPLVTWAFLGGGLWAADHFLGAGTFWEPVFLLSCLLLAFSLIMNFNPFIRMDAYYMLMDWSGVSNLREKSFRFMARELFGRWLPGRPQKRPYGARLKAIFWVYGVLGALVTVALFILPFAYFARLAMDDGPHGGRVIMGLAALALALFGLGHKAVKRLRRLRRRAYKIK